MEDNVNGINDEYEINESEHQKSTEKRQKLEFIEKHFCELIMLFTAWRDEEKDVMGNFSPSKE